MYKIISITNRTLCKDDYFKRIKRLCKENIDAIIVREKDMDPEEYRDLFQKVKSICDSYEVPCILHSFVDVAIRLQVEKIHVPLPILRKMSKENKMRFSTLGTSCHSVEDALEAEKLGCTYIVVGHIFETNCKKDLPPRGLSFLEKVKEVVSIPVYAIGGVNEQTVRKIHCSGACIMSGFMECENIKEYLTKIRDGAENEI